MSFPNKKWNKNMDNNNDIYSHLKIDINKQFSLGKMKPGFFRMDLSH